MSNRSSRPVEAAAPCAQIQSRLFAFVDGDLNAGERSAVQAHLDRCADCRRELALCRRSEAALFAAPFAAPPAGDLRPGFYARLAASEAQSRRRFPGWRLAASALALGALALVWLRPFEPGTHPSRGQVGAYIDVLKESTFSGNAGETAGATAANGANADRLRKSMEIALGMMARSALALATAPEQTPVRAHPRHEMRHRGALPAPASLSDLVKSTGQVVALNVHSPRSTAPLVGEDETVKRALNQKLYSPLSTTPAPEAEKDRASAAHLDLATPVDSGESFSLDVHDDVRGFTASAHLASVVEERNGDQVITIEAQGDTLNALP